MSDITNRLSAVESRVARAAEAAHRQRESITLLAVSKTRPVEDIEAALAAGQRHFGENYLQDAEAKIARIGTRAIWHFIGPIQSNKTRAIAEQFDWVHSVDRLKIARRLSEQRPADLAPLNICLQVNTSEERTKAGVPPDEVAELAEQVASLPRLRLRGLMTIPASESDPQRQRVPFRQLREIFQALKQRGYSLDTLSMGMSNDMEAAIAEGATLVRIGTAIFGTRISRPASG